MTKRRNISPALAMGDSSVSYSIFIFLLFSSITYDIACTLET